MLELGFDYFLGKPIDEGKFRALLDGKPLRRADSGAGEASSRPSAFVYWVPDARIGALDTLVVSGGGMLVLVACVALLSDVRRMQ